MSSRHTNTSNAQIVRKKQAYQVKITNCDGTVIYARRERHSRRIIYDRPESVPRVMKHVIVPDLFDQIDRMRTGS